MRDKVTFVLNGEIVAVRGVAPTTTVLNYLRRVRALSGTKEGCAEGDCGACTVVVGELVDGEIRYRAVNACIQLLPMLEGKSLVTVEALKEPSGAGRKGAESRRLHPAQQALVDRHGSQCGFCTPGFVMSLYAAYVSGDAPPRSQFNDILAGNLCRCTGYGPILDAAVEMYRYEKPDWDDERRANERVLLETIQHNETVKLSHGEQVFISPADIEDLANIFEEQPDATLVAGATDVGLWVTKLHRDINTLIYIGRVAELNGLSSKGGIMSIGAGVTFSDAAEAITAAYSDFGELLRRIGAVQVRNAGTIGGNIANGSPIGDTPPALIALGAQLVLRKGNASRRIPLEDYFIAYGRQDRQPGEFVEAVEVPLNSESDRLRCYKVSKRFDQDISALCGCFNIRVDSGNVIGASICFGGMAATPLRARAVEAALTGKPWTMDSVKDALAAFDDDYSPLSDMRASAEYRQQVAKNLLIKYFYETRERGFGQRDAGQQASNKQDAGQQLLATRLVGSGGHGEVQI